MRTCPKCGEINGDNNTKCFKCDTILGPASSQKKICPSCKTIYAGSKETCDQCHCPLAVYGGSSSMYSGGYEYGTPGWAYAVAILLPLIGIIMGLIYLGRREDDMGKTMIITSIIASVVWALLGFIIL